MQWQYKHLLNNNFHPDSKVWAYQSSRLFNLDEALEIEELLKEFTHQWKSHGTPVKSDAHLFFGQFIILIADETATGVSGCSTDSSVRLIKDIEQRFKVNMFDRTTLAFIIKDKPDSYRVELLPMTHLQHAIDNGFINLETLYFNNLVQTKDELNSNWMIAIKDSWLTKKISISSKVL